LSIEIFREEEARFYPSAAWALARFCSLAVVLRACQKLWPAMPTAMAITKTITGGESVA
jgi:hypothetical protein